MFKIPLVMLPEAIITGGLHGRARGNVNGIIYGAARTRIGKVVTAREYVIPSDPKTAAQVIQRRKFEGTLYAVRHLGSTLWQGDFNRSIGQLPGFQSMMSIILVNTDNTFVLAVPPDTPLGNLTVPLGLTVVTGVGASGDIDLAWNGGLGLNGTANDVLEVFGIEEAEAAAGVRGANDFSATAIRSDTSLVVPTGASATDWIVGVYMQGAGTALGLLSICSWYAVTSKA